MINNMSPAMLRTIYAIKPSFGIYQANGKRKEGLKKAFVEVMELNSNDDVAILKDFSIWPLFIEDASCGNGITKFIVSFQVYENGDYFAVARLYKDKEK